VSTQASLQTPEEVLESPLQEAPPKGMIPRSSLFFALGVFLLALLAFAAYDLYKTSSGNQPKTDDADKKAASQMAALKVGPPPPSSDIAGIAKSQGDQGDIVAARTSAGGPLPAERIGGKAIAPSDVPTEIKPGSVVQVGVNRKNPLDMPAGETARDQREGVAAVSPIISIEGSGGSGGVAETIERTGLPGASRLAGAIDPIQRQIDEYKRGSKSSSEAADPSAEVVKLMASMQTGQNAVRAGKDQTWLKETSTEKVAEATYAKASASPWMIFQGTRVPIVTREAINSDLPGPVTALSTSPVFDSINQCAVLIPTGTKFIGTYSADIRPGQSRLLLAYRRMIFPDGRSVELDGAQAVDQIGAAGAEGNVNNHFLSMFGYGFAVALLANSAGGGSGVTVTQPNGSSTTTTVAGQVLSDIGSRIMGRNSTIPPTISIDVGSRMFVTIVRDIALTPTSRSQCK